MMFPEGSPKVPRRSGAQNSKHMKKWKSAKMFKNIQEITSQEIYDHLDEKWNDDGDDDDDCE